MNGMRERESERHMLSPIHFLSISNGTRIWSFSFSEESLSAYQSFGVVYGDLSTSPLYVYTSTLSGKLQSHLNEEVIFGIFSLIFWTLTLIPLLKYVVIILNADDNGEGGTFALYSLLCRHANISLLPNQQAADEEMSCYKNGLSPEAAESSSLKRFLENHRSLKTALLVVVLLGACMVIGDGVFSPAISILAAVSGVRVTKTKFTDVEVVLIACVILVGLFALQHYGTHKVAFVFAPVVIIWLAAIFSIGLYNIIYWNPKIFHAISPLYLIKFFIKNAKEGWISLGGMLLCITGTEAMFADIGHFTTLSIRLAFAFVIYPCLVVQYMGQAAFLSKNLNSVHNSFYDSIPEPILWPVFVIATLAAIVGSQAVITATFSIIKQCHVLGCFPRVKIVHTSKHMFGQIYIPEINWILMILTLAVTIGFRDTTLIGNAYGLACMTVMFVTTFLMALVIMFVWQKNILIATIFLLFFWVIEGLYLSAALIKVFQGGWVPLVLSFIFMLVMHVWHYGTCTKYNYDLSNKVSLKWLLALGPSLGVARVPGIGLIYTELATGIPAIFSHFVTNLPAFHMVLVFVCVKTVPVPHVLTKERFLIGRVCPRPYRMYRCTVRYGYKDIRRDDRDFDNHIIRCIAEFIQIEAQELQLSISETSSFDGGTTIISVRSFESVSSWTVSENEDVGVDNNIASGRSFSRQPSISTYDKENPHSRRRHVSFLVPDDPALDHEVKQELLDLAQAMEAGVAYIMGHTHVKARKSSSLLKRLVINVGYAFLRTNCRGPATALNIPHISLIEVGMIYYV
ncbi:Potassium transporter 4 [Glycine max]|nr:Potassium transporter 4 [Glycine max]